MVILAWGRSKLGCSSLWFRKAIVKWDTTVILAWGRSKVVLHFLVFPQSWEQHLCDGEKLWTSDSRFLVKSSWSHYVAVWSCNQYVLPNFSSVWLFHPKMFDSVCVKSARWHVHVQCFYRVQVNTIASLYMNCVHNNDYIHIIYLHIQVNSWP